MWCAVLGPLEVHGDDGEQIQVAGAKERQLLAVLAAGCPGVVGVDRIVDLLWEGMPPATARKSLQAHVVHLRTAFEPGRPRGSPGRYIVRRGEGYALAVDRTMLDTLAFVDATARGRALLSAGDPAGARSELASALRMWRGEPYADWPDSSFAEAERRRLSAVRTNAEQSLFEAELALGHHGDVIPDLQRRVVEQPLHEAGWALLALALYRDGRQGDALETVRRARSVLRQELGVDPGPRLRALEKAMLRQDPEVDVPSPVRGEDRDRSPADRTTATGACPYKGLATYQVEDAALFCGRDRLVATLVRMLVDNPLLVVSGSSGAGKSSVVRAGLLPRLSAGVLPGSTAWSPLVLSTGEHSVDELAPLTGDEAPPGQVLLVCDQLEQLWAAGADPAERQAFLDTVLGLVADDRVVRCVLVVRGDHVGRMAEHEGMAERMAAGGLVLVPPLTEPELREVVEAPARAVGLVVEPELVDVVVADVLGRVGALPLLSTALVGTWERRRNGVLTLAGYLEAGGVAGALARSAEMVYGSFDDRGRQIARRLMVRLADTDEQGFLTRRQVLLEELGLDGGDGEARRAVVETLVAHRLIIVDGGRVEVAHEALLVSWPRMVGWLEEDGIGRNVRRHLAPAAQAWQHGGRPADELYRGARLDAALEWAASPDADVTEVEGDFLEASRQLAESELQEATARADSEAAGRRRTRRLATGLATALVLVLLAAGLALRFQRDAEERATEAGTASTVADANRLSALSTTARALDLSLLLAAAAVRTARTPATEDGLLAALVEHRRATRVSALGHINVEETAVGDGGRTLFAVLGGDEPKVVAVPVDSDEEPHVVDDWWPDHLAASPTDDLVAAAGFRGDGVTLAVYTAEGVEKLALTAADLGGYARDAVFTSDGRLLTVFGSQANGSAGWTATLAEVDLTDGSVRRRTVLRATTRPDVHPLAAFAADGSAVVVSTEPRLQFAVRVDTETGARTAIDLQHRRAASREMYALPGATAQTWSDGAVSLYGPSGHPTQVLDVHEKPVRDIVVGAARTAVTVGDGGAVELWDVDPSGLWSRRESLTGHAGDVEEAELSPDGQTLLTAARGGEVVWWDLTTDAGFGTTYAGLGDRWISNRIDVLEPGKLVVAPTRRVPRTDEPGLMFYSSPDAVQVAATFLDPVTGRVVDEVVVGDTVDGAVFGSSVAASPDHTLVAVTSGQATTVLDAQTRQVVARIVLPRTRPPEGFAAELVWCVEWSQDGSKLLVGAEGRHQDRAGENVVDDGNLVVVDTSSWRIEERVDIGGSAQVMEWSPDRSQLAVGRAYVGEVLMLDGATLEVQQKMELAEGDHPFDLSYSSDGSRLAVGGDAGLVNVLDTATWRLVRDPVQVHTKPVLDVEWMPGNATVLTTGMDGTVAMYDVERDLVRARPLPGSGEPGEGYAHLLPGADDELVVLSGHRDGRRYPMDPAVWLAQACVVAGRDLTREEWARYLPDRTYRPTCSDLVGR